MQNYDNQFSNPALDYCVMANLSQTLGGPFQIFRETDLGWVVGDESADGSDTLVLAADEHQSWFTEIRQAATSTPHFRTSPTGQSIIAVLAESEEGDVRIVSGPVTRTAQQMAAQLASISNAHCELQEKQHLLEDYADRLTDSFEELTFLRSISNQLVFCVANHALKDVSNEILPKLRSILSVEAVLLIAATDSDQLNFAADVIIAKSGLLPCSQGEIVELVSKQRARQTLVYNHQRPNKRFKVDIVPDIKSLAIVPVEKSGQLFGWLVAINKVVDFGQFHKLGEDELGTMEGSLLEAAASMLAAQAANNQLFQEKEELVVDVIHTLVGVIESRDQYTCGHSDRVALYSRRMALHLGLSTQECQEVFLGGLLHDIGKVGVSDDVLLKPGSLTDEEFAEIKKHPLTGAKLLQGMKPFEKLIPLLLSHHEAIDGSGYPNGLKGDQIPLLARIVAVADAYDAMTSDRPYRKGMEVSKALGILQAGAGKQWDAKVVAALLEVLDDIHRVSDGWESHLQKMLHSTDAQSGAPKRDTASFVAAFGNIGLSGAPVSSKSVDHIQ